MGNVGSVTVPIRKELLPLYRTPEYLAARDRVRKRAGGSFDEGGRYLGGAHCEQCRVIDHKMAVRACGWWTPASLEATVHMMGGRFTDGHSTAGGVFNFLGLGRMAWGLNSTASRGSAVGGLESS